MPRNSVAKPGLPLLGRIGLLTLMAVFAGGCSLTGVPLNEPVFTGSTPNQRAIIGGQAAQHAASQPDAEAPAAPAGAVARQDLPPPGGDPQPAAGQQVASLPPGSGPQPYTPPAPYAAHGMPTPVGRVEAPSRRSSDAAPKAAAAPAAPARQSGAAASGGAYVVKPGDSLWSIARAHNVTTSDLLAANGLDSPTIRPGQTLAIPGRGGPEPQVASLAPAQPRAAAPAPEARPPAPAPQPEARASEPAPPAVEAQPQAPAAAPQAAQPAPGAEATVEGRPAAGFRWPVRGRIIAGFGRKPDGQRNDGINLAVPEGTTVRAAEDGTVIYAGDELKSYGNLILIRHENGWVSAYAHNKELLVRRGDEVRRGQVIAHSGMTGNVTSPQLHFELRRGATPVDPLPHMAET